MKLTPNMLHLISDLLEMAAEEFSRHGCNDFDLSEWLDPDEQQSFVRGFHEWNGDPEEFNPERPEMGDSCVMSYLSGLFYDAAEKAKCSQR
jgi:hypothetical protein